MKSSNKLPAIFLLGPTASGKTDWAIKLHQKYQDKLTLISVDSVLVYRDCNIGANKPSQEVLKKHPHHLIDILDIKEVYNVASFINDVKKIVRSSAEQDKIPLLVGGTMMYFHALKSGLNNLPDTDLKIRNELTKFVEDHGSLALFEELTQIDPDAAKKISPNDTQRLIRAIEIIKSSQDPPRDKGLNPLSDDFNLIEIGIFPERVDIHHKIHQRQKEIIGDQLIEEVQRLLTKYNPKADHPVCKAINYRQVIQMLNGQISKQEIFDKTLFATRQFAKRQITWMRSWNNLYMFSDRDFDGANELLKKTINF